MGSLDSPLRVRLDFLKVLLEDFTEEEASAETKMTGFDNEFSFFFPVFFLTVFEKGFAF